MGQEQNQNFTGFYMELYIGLMSGTSADGINAALVDFSTIIPTVISTHYAPYSLALRQKIHGLSHPGDNEIQRLGELDIELGLAFANAVNHLLEQQSLTAHAIRAIGSHGQTIRHHPVLPHPFTLQIGDPNTIAAKTEITTIADFRRKDMSLGGQGAPLVPAFHQALFAADNKPRVIANIGGMANITVLMNDTVIGFDTGPGNVLMDSWILHHQQKSHDENGAWARQGKLQTDLLNQLLADPYFKRTPPKSTGREYFNLAWTQAKLNATLSPVDVQTTLTELTAQTIIDTIQSLISEGEILICGGGVHNDFLMQRLQKIAAPHFNVSSTMQYGIDPDWVEAMAFAWLAKQTMQHKTGNLPSVTGAKKPAILGGIYYP